MHNTRNRPLNSVSATGEQLPSDLAHTKVDPYEDPFYNALTGSPASAVGDLKPVGQGASMTDQCPKAVEQDGSMVPRPYQSQNSDSPKETPDISGDD